MTRRSATGSRWTEADSKAFDAFGDVVVPSRAEQIDTLCALIPASADESFTAVELAAGGGKLARAVLDRFPRCHYVALDGSPHMRARLREVLAPFGRRAVVAAFRLEAARWRAALPRPLRCVLTSLAVHHLTAGQKRRLFADLAGRLEPGGALLIADLVEPAAARVGALFASQWDRAAREQSGTGPRAARTRARFAQGGWNYYRLTTPDPVDQPSRLLDQLDWLRRAGLHAVDCFWMRAGHAIFGGYRGGRAPTAPAGEGPGGRGVSLPERRRPRRAPAASARPAAGKGRTSPRSRRTRTRTR
ncbi:MAG TPA: class I SAM-dependent methyltransferase [bacterium]|nr:class I SAM-dependent methyltransferase [bacterium]